MKETWDKYIKPILDSSIDDHFNWIWDPFLVAYPKLDVEKRVQLEDALLECAFDNDLDIAIKALAIIGALCGSNNLPSLRLFELTANKLREHIGILKVDTDASFYYITAIMDLDIKEAIPLLEMFVSELREKHAKGMIPDVRSDDRNDYRNNYKDMMWICCLSLAHLKPDQKNKWLETFWREFPERKNKIGVYGTGNFQPE